MKPIVRILVTIVGLFSAALGLGFLLDPAKLSATFALAPVGIQGLATVRADFPAFFLTGAAFALIGAWRADPRPLRVPIALFSIALTGRFVSLALDGAPHTAFVPMMAEAAMIAVLLAGRRAFSK